MSASRLPLAGRGIVITRPAAQARALAALVESYGGRAILVPTIEIKDLEDPSVLSSIIDRLDSYELAIFISANAATKAFQAIRARRTWPDHLQVAAVGR